MIEPELLLQGYRLGVFPMAMENGEIEWFSPDPRAIIPLGEFHVPHGLRRALSRKVFEIRINTSFADVIRLCAERADTWINDEIIQSYTRLHELGHAHSVEAWQKNESRGRALRRGDWRRIFWRIDVPSRDGRIQDCALRIGGAFAYQEIPSPRHAMAHAASRAIWLHRNSAK